MDFLLTFFKDLILRFASKTPVFFKVLRILGIIAAGVAELPALLSKIGITIDPVSEPYKTILFVAGVVTAIVSSLPVSSASKNADEINTK